MTDGGEFAKRVEMVVVKTFFMNWEVQRETYKMHIGLTLDIKKRK